MYRSALRSAPRALRASMRPAANLASAAPRRFASTTPAARKSTWKGAAFRWALAVGAVYWYNTSPIFADESEPQTRLPPPQFPEDLTVDKIVEEKRMQLAATEQAGADVTRESEKDDIPTQDKDATPAEGIPEEIDGEHKSPEELEEEAGQQGAFDPETGEINWDCPCLGGMAHGPCGEEFKAAFSCFVYSKDEPKGMDCIDKFQHMQDCFRQYPEVYSAELADDEEEGAPAPGAEEGVATSAEKTADSAAESAPSSAPKLVASTPPPNGNRPEQQLQEEDQLEEEDIPKKAFDATEGNKNKEN